MSERGVIWPVVIECIGSDPLHILRSTSAVMRSARDVVIDMNAVEHVAGQLLTKEVTPEWDASLHNPGIPTGDVEATAIWILLLDALNFCFWGQGADPSVRWRVERNGVLLDGYVALVAALERGIGEDVRFHDPEWLATMSQDQVADLLRPAPGHPETPLFDTRCRNVREIGQGLIAFQSELPATDFLESASGSAITLIHEVLRVFPSFRDVAIWSRTETGLPGNEVRFYKRAQILAGDLAGALKHSSLGQFHDLDQLTAFADYKVPQVLHSLGILHYSDDLTDRIARREHIPAGSESEIEIRAATIWGCELLRQALRNRGRAIPAHELDWLLWEQGQSLPEGILPYHLTPTINY